ncbi:DNA (cytosine-5)-methyltransferase 1 [Bradyrhizobium japonicum]|nr:DNA (cytosine-5)-methyltransferase 1 [Bradyrhizobium japonicum]
MFCGVGGLTRGLEKSGIAVRLGVDIDPNCEYPYTANNGAKFLLKSVTELTAKDLDQGKIQTGYKLLAGCAPCQPFSTYRQKTGAADDRWKLLDHFGRLARETKPDLITMENVPNLEKQSIFRDFVAALKKMEYHVSYEVVDCSEFGVPQQRRRLVLLASKLGPIELVRPKSKKARTVRQAIGRLPRIEAGGVHLKDPLHQSCELSELNLKRIRASKPGGTWRDWDRELVAACHRRKTGKTYPGVYGRMVWDEPAPTMTTQYYAFGSGRFGHPSQARGISLREGALLQSFPRDYKFVKKGQPIFRKTVGRLIGNAVPVKLGEAIGRSIIAHVRSRRDPKKAA